MATLPHALDKRRDERDSRFSGEYSCRLIPTDNEGKIIPIRPLDVSKRGLGFLAKENLKQGGFYWLVIGSHKYRVEVAYCGNHLGIDSLYRCGLFLREVDGDLAATCAKEGLLTENKSSKNHR